MSHSSEYHHDRSAISSTTPPTKLASSKSSSSKFARSSAPLLHPRRSTSYPIYPRLALARSCVVLCARLLPAKVTSSETCRQSLSLLPLTLSKPRSLPFFKFEPFSCPSFMYLLSELWIAGDLYLHSLACIRIVCFLECTTTSRSYRHY